MKLANYLNEKFLKTINRIAIYQGNNYFQIVIENRQNIIHIYEYDNLNDLINDWNYLTQRLFNSKILINIRRKK